MKRLHAAVSALLIIGFMLSATGAYAETIREESTQSERPATATGYESSYERTSSIHCYSNQDLRELLYQDIPVTADEPATFMYLRRKQRYMQSQQKSYTDDEIFYLAAVICREAGFASDEIQLLVANVVINRVNSEIYPNTIYEVLTQYKQYGNMWRDGISFPTWATDDIIAHCREIATRILDGERVCPANVLFQAEFVQGSGIYKQYDGYYFCYYG